MTVDSGLLFWATLYSVRLRLLTLGVVKAGNGDHAIRKDIQNSCLSTLLSLKNGQHLSLQCGQPFDDAWSHTDHVALYTFISRGSL